MENESLKGIDESGRVGLRWKPKPEPAELLKFVSNIGKHIHNGGWTARYAKPLGSRRFLKLDQLYSTGAHPPSSYRLRTPAMGQQIELCHHNLETHAIQPNIQHKFIFMIINLVPNNVSYKTLLAAP